MDQMPMGPRGGWPDFLVIGAAKSGTTALDEFLRQHPDLRLPAAREPNHFAFPGRPPNLRDHRGRSAAVVHTSVVDPQAYLESFPPSRTGTRAGETSPAYLYVPGTAERIAAVRPDMRLVVILRDPAARAFSAYQHLRREGREPLGFGAAVAAEADRIAHGWGLLWRYVDTGRYGQQLARYLDVFPQEQLLVLRHEDLVRTPLEVCRRVFAFIGVRPVVPIDTTGRFNVSGVPRSQLLHRLSNPPAPVRRAVARLAPDRVTDRLRRVHADATSRNLQRPEPDAEVLAHIRGRLASDLDLLAELTGWDVSAWR